jgi:hypothetical protein
MSFEIERIEQLETAFETFAHERVDAVLVPPDTTFNTHYILHLYLDRS